MVFQLFSFPSSEKLVLFVHLLPSHILQASDTNTYSNIFLDSWLFVIINLTQLIPLISSLFGSLHARISPQQFPKSSANFSLQYSHVSPAALCVGCWTVKAQVRKMEPCETMVSHGFRKEKKSASALSSLPCHLPTGFLPFRGDEHLSIEVFPKQSFLALTKS